jgi:hypothetical protein
MLAKEKIDAKKFFFIDFMSGRKASMVGVEFVSPNNLTEFGIIFSRSLDERHVDASLFDNISPVLVYNAEKEVLKLMISAITMARGRNITFVMIMLKTDKNLNFARELFIFVDKIM